MPNTKSAVKAARQNIKKRATNLATQTNVRTAVKKFKQLVASGKMDEAKQALSQVYASLDKAAKKHVIHKNRAARRKSRLSKLIAKKI